MKRGIAVFVTIAVACLAWTAPPGFAQRPDAKPGVTLASAERQAIELKQGMNADAVERLLGKPKRTALKQGSGADAAQGSLQWSYMWPGPNQRDDTLQVVFARKPAGDWLVESWGWNSSY